MTIYEQALKDIYSAEHVALLLATIQTQRLITGDPSAPSPVGLIHGKSPIATAINDMDVAQRAMKNWRNP